MEKTEGRVVSTTKSLSPSPHITNEKSETKKLNIITCSKKRSWQMIKPRLQSWIGILKYLDYKMLMFLNYEDGYYTS